MPSSLFVHILLCSSCIVVRRLDLFYGLGLPHRLSSGYLTGFALSSISIWIPLDPPLWRLLVIAYACAENLNASAAQDCKSFFNVSLIGDTDVRESTEQA
ncbi:hypothetical protein BS47DRAFT_1392153 [Hydnum rufescens UP504]|uniref:Uncharacterized protein n=1 Tax=Hydnum rufescens UP504 TaxID=1448309 RepID=A0A9P6DXC9_9AGAM|nr:hypothetical protein BS47DRAFT_1392153 [Hydnum rufescens UP504]